MLARSIALGERMKVFVSARDPISSGGIANQLHGQGVDLVDESSLDAESVAVVVVDEIDDEAVRELRKIGRAGTERMMVVATRVDDRGLLAAVEAGASGIVRRSEATPYRLRDAIQACAAGD